MIRDTRMAVSFEENMVCHPTHGGISRIAKDFMNQGKELLRRLRTTEANTLTKEEIRMLRLHLHLLDIEVSNRALEPK
jgi:hypothetical protein